jgi:hypothetical protein
MGLPLVFWSPKLTLEIRGTRGSVVEFQDPAGEFQVELTLVPGGRD